MTPFPLQPISQLWVPTLHHKTSMSCQMVLFLFSCSSIHSSVYSFALKADQGPQQIHSPSTANFEPSSSSFSQPHSLGVITIPLSRVLPWLLQLLTFPCCPHLGLLCWLLLPYCISEDRCAPGLTLGSGFSSLLSLHLHPR